MQYVNNKEIMKERRKQKREVKSLGRDTTIISFYVNITITDRKMHTSTLSYFQLLCSIVSICIRSKQWHAKPLEILCHILGNLNF